MNYIRWRVWFLFIAIAAGIILLLKYSTGGSGAYKSSSPITDSLVTSAYPDLYEALSQRNAQLLKPFLTHENRQVREQGWRALAVTPVDSPAPYLELAVQQNSEVAWFAVSQKNIAESRLRQLEELWSKNSSHRKGISTVLGQQGDEQSLNFLLSHLNSEVGSEFPFALAVSRLITRFEINQDEQIDILQQAFEVENEQVLRAYLYGWYRGPKQQLAATAQDTLFSRWQLFGIGTNPQIDQYVNKLLKGRTTSTITIFYNGEQRLEEEAQLSIELAQSIGEIKLGLNSSLAAKILLTHPNVHVQRQTLKSLTGKIDQSNALYKYIKNSMITDSRIANLVWLQALEVIAQLDSSSATKYRKRLDEIPEENSYLVSEVLAIYEELLSPEEYLQKIEVFINKEESIFAMEALQRLNIYWETLPDDEKAKPLIEKVRKMIFGALDSADRGIAYMAQPLLQKDELFYESDFEQINKKLSAFSLPQDIEVYQRFGVLYKERFEEQAQPLIDSLAALNYVPLNRSLAEAGWEIETAEGSPVDFRMPDWKRLWELGQHPVWTLQTEKGDIKIQLNTLSAPATVSAIDSLSRAGAYENIPFHRVVPNFVIQGGDIERRDGFGGPDYVIPTEPSEQGFIRGAAGIASAGTDTEGSQYFIMHQWKPHLNGNYTRFGEVIDGMEVVDRIIDGDKVLFTTWY